MAVFVPSEYMHTGRYLTNLLYSLFVMAEVFCNTAEEDRPGLNGFMSFFHSLISLECFFLLLFHRQMLSHPSSKIQSQYMELN